MEASHYALQSGAIYIIIVKDVHVQPFNIIFVLVEIVFWKAFFLKSFQFRFSTILMCYSPIINNEISELIKKQKRSSMVMVL